MKILRVHTVYFSATGTTERVVNELAGELAERLGAELVSHCFNLPQSREETLTFGPEDLVVVGLPVYAGRVPNLLLPYLREKVKGNDTPAVPVVLFGNRDFDDGLIELRDTLWDNGLRSVAAGAFAGEHAFSKTLGAGRPDEQDMELVSQLARHAAEKIEQAEQAPARPVPVEGCTPLRPYYTPRDRNGTPINILKVKPRTDLQKCVSCGLCARLCPMGSIDPEEVVRVTGVCIKCCACVKKCPAGAKYFDDAGFLYHQHELEELYARRADSRIFF